MALVTGGSSGFGRGVADALAAEGVRLALAAGHEGSLAEASGDSMWQWGSMSHLAEQPPPSDS